MAVDFSSWDGPAVMSAGAKSADPAAFYKSVCAGRKDGDPKLQASWALPYKKSPGAGPNAAGVRNALSRLPQTDGLTNKAEAQKTLEAALKQVQAAEEAKKSVSPADHRAPSDLVAIDAAIDEAMDCLSGVDRDSLPASVNQFIDLVTAADKVVDSALKSENIPDPDDPGNDSTYSSGTAPELDDDERGRNAPALIRSGRDARKQRAAAAARNELPTGARMHAFPAQMRGHLVERDGKTVYEVDGYATVFNRGYAMWDMFGEYTEQVADTALDKSLAANPDVAFLVNHKGVTMARTKSGSLELSKDAIGMRIHAFLNAERQDVRDLALAMDDRDVDEMSFAFMLNNGEWNADYDQFSITEADINRGDVSAVNYGANPYTSIAARAAEFMDSIERMPDAIARAAFDRLSAHPGVEIPDVTLEASADREAERAEVASGHKALLTQALVLLGD